MRLFEDQAEEGFAGRSFRNCFNCLNHNARLQQIPPKHPQLITAVLHSYFHHPSEKHLSISQASQPPRACDSLIHLTSLSSASLSQWLNHLPLLTPTRKASCTHGRTASARPVNLLLNARDFLRRRASMACHTPHLRSLPMPLLSSPTLRCPIIVLCMHSILLSLSSRISQT